MREIKRPMRCFFRRLARRAHAAHANEAGSTLVELALSVPLLIIIVILAMAVLLVIQARFGVQAAAREAGMVGAQVNTTIDPYNRQIEAATTVAEGVLEEYSLNVDQATITFDGTPDDLRRGSLFQVQIDYDVLIPTPSLVFWNQHLGGETAITVHSVTVVPIQLHKARWPCPSPDPICS
jgi:Flp pilus assembly protein TadG